MDLADELYGQQGAQGTQGFDLAADLYGDKKPEPVKLGREGFADAVRQTMGDSWLGKQVGSFALQARKAGEGLMGGNDPLVTEAANVGAQEAPIGALAADVVKYAPAALAATAAAPVAGPAAVAGLIGAATTPGSAGERAKAGATDAALSYGLGKGMQGLAWAAKKIGQVGNLELARKALEDIIGTQNMPEALRLARSASVSNAPVGVSSEQALESLGNPNIANLARITHGSSVDSAAANAALLAEQKAARVAAMEGITPNLGAAQFARFKAAEPVYKQAESVIFKADPQLEQLAANPYYKKAVAEAADLIQADAQKGITFDTNPTKVLQNVKFGLDKMLGRTGDTALSGAEQRVVLQVKNDLLAWMNEKNPLFKQANEIYAGMSQPVNQSKVLTAMTGKLQTPVGAESRSAFLNTMGTGEDALLKRSTGVPRYVSGDIQAITTPRQYGVVQDVAGQLQRDANLLMQRSSEGSRAAVVDAIKQGGLLQRLPNFLWRPAMVANKGIQEAEIRVNAAMMRRLDEAMRSPTKLADLLMTKPVEQRNALIKFLYDTAASGTPAVAGGTLADLAR